jgi:phage gp29-like protein
MEERDLHYRGVLFTRRSVVTGLTPAVEAVDDSAEEQAIADDVRTLVWEPWFHELVFDLMDSVAKGTAIEEILWETSEKQYCAAYVPNEVQRGRDRETSERQIGRAHV